MKIYTTTKYKDFLMYINTLGITEPQLQELLSKAGRIAIPERFKVNYNSLIFGKLCALQSIDNNADFFTKAPFIILEPVTGWRSHRYIKKVIDIWHRYIFLNSKFLQSLSFIVNMQKELDRITQAFKSIEYKPTREEEKAGIKEANNSMHNIADWYALRMGITDVNQVYLIPWSIIWKAMQIDNSNNEIKRRLYEIQSKKK